MKARLQNLCDNRVTTLIVLQAIQLLSAIILVCTEFSVAGLIVLLIVTALDAWFISGLVKLRKGAFESGTNTIRRFMKFICVIVWILTIIGILISVITMISLLGLIGQEKVAVYLLLFLAGLTALMVYELCAVHSLKNTARRAHDIAIGAENIGRQGIFPEIYCFIEIVVTLLILFIPHVFELLFATLDFELTREPIVTNVSVRSILNTVLSMAKPVIAYTLLRDFRKIVNE